MKVVLLAGGLGTRMREETQFRPKPMVPVGGEPLIWHIMRVFANHGHGEFVICAGYKKEVIEAYFESEAWKRKAIELSHRFPPPGVPEQDWKVDVLDTGPSTQTAGRVIRARGYIGRERFFLGYGDSLADVDISELLNQHIRRGVTSTVTLAHPTSRFGVANVDGAGMVRSFQEKPLLEALVSIGFFVLEPDVFSVLDEHSMLEEGPLAALATSGNLFSFEHNGYWQAVDTYRELLQVQKLWDSGEAGWVSTKTMGIQSNGSTV